jgi:psiF repeat
MRDPVKTKFIATLACAAAVFVSPALAAEGDPDSPTYHDRFITCAHESKGLKGEEHQSFMSECLKRHATDVRAHATEASHKASADSPQHNRMKTCNEEAGKKNLHGDERRAFMSTCLKG